MDLSAYTQHLLHFMAPAWGVALFVALLARLATRWGWLPRANSTLVKQVALSGCAGTVVLVAGLVLSGVDGKMSTYGVLVVICATVQWQMCRA